MNKSVSALSSDGATLAKIIATFCVVLRHSYKIFEFIGVEETEVFYLRGFHAIGASGVPVFFLLSGYFLTVKDNFDYYENLKKKFRSLAIPYLCFMLFYAVINCTGSLFLPEFFDDFRKYTAYDWLTHFFGIPFVSTPRFYGPLWFLRELFIFNVLSFALVPIAKKTPGFILVPAMLAVYFSPFTHIIRFSIPFFMIGMHYGTKKKIPVLNKTIYIIAVFIIGFIIPVALAGGMPFEISVFLMFCSILMISEKLTERDNIRKMARIAIPYSFPIYLMHEYPMITMLRLLALEHISIPAAVGVFFVAPFLIIALCVFVVNLWKRFSPKSFAFCTGGR